MAENDRKDERAGAPEAAGAAGAAEKRKARLAEQLRSNLQRRKQQARARRAGAADERQGLPAPEGEPED